MTSLLACVRFAHLASLSLLVGIAASHLWLGRLILPRGEARCDADWGGLRRRLRRLAAWSLWVGIASLLAWLLLQAAAMSGLPLAQAVNLRIVWTVLARTEFGHVWAVRLGLLGLLALVFFRETKAQATGGSAAPRLAGFLLGSAAMATLAWVGHAAAAGGSARLLHLAADVIHLLATGAWLGGLLPLGLVLHTALRSPDARGRGAAGVVIRRFSALGLMCVASLLLTGLVNTWILVGSLPALVGTAYGRLLLVKLVLIALTVCVAAHSRLRLMPDFSAHTRTRIPDEPLRLLRRNVLAELFVGGTILVVVSFLGIAPPAIHVQPMWPFPVRLGAPPLWNIPGTVWVAIIGGVAALLGVIAAVMKVQLRRWGWCIIAAGLVLMTYCGGRALLELTVKAYPTTYWRSPAKYEVASVAGGLRLYRENCAVCHGLDGRGDGPAGRALRPPPANLTARHTGEHTAGDLFWWLSHGIRGSAMPGFEDRLSEAERWDLVSYLRTLPAAEEARRFGPRPRLADRIVAPDFTFSLPDGSTRRLKDERGKAVVLVSLFTLPGSRDRLSQLVAARAALAAAGAEPIAVPLCVDAAAERQIAPRQLPSATDEAPEITAAYTLFSRFGPAGNAPRLPDHVEFLIDRQGYIRALWIPEMGTGWGEMKGLLAEIDRLARESPGPSAPEDHVH